MKLRAEFADLIENHRLPTSDYDVRGWPLVDRGYDRVDGPRFPFWLPGRVASVAEPAAEVATAGPNENAGGPCKAAFPLDAVKNF